MSGAGSLCMGQVPCKLVKVKCTECTYTTLHLGDGVTNINNNKINLKVRRIKLRYKENIG